MTKTEVFVFVVFSALVFSGVFLAKEVLFDSTARELVADHTR